jgi:hypothetical protein
VRGIRPPTSKKSTARGLAHLYARNRTRRGWRAGQGLPMITTAGDEMQIIAAVIAPGMVRHRANLLGAGKKSCDIRPRVSTFIRNVKVGRLRSGRRSRGAPPSSSSPTLAQRTRQDGPPIIPHLGCPILFRVLCGKGGWRDSLLGNRSWRSHLVLSRMATLPSISMGIARSGAWS